MEDKGKGSERWNGAISNLTEMSFNLESLQKLLLKKAVFVDEETFAKASLCSEQARTIKVFSFIQLFINLYIFKLILQSGFHFCMQSGEFCCANLVENIYFLTCIIFFFFSYNFGSHSGLDNDFPFKKNYFYKF